MSVNTRDAHWDVVMESYLFCLFNMIILVAVGGWGNIEWAIPGWRRRDRGGDGHVANIC